MKRAALFCTCVVVLCVNATLAYPLDGPARLEFQQQTVAPTPELLPQEPRGDMGACCFDDGTCVVTTESDCLVPVWGDLDGDGDIDEDDYLIFLAAFGHVVGDPQYMAEADFDADGFISFVDYQEWLLCYYNEGYIGDCFMPGATCADADSDRIPDCLEDNDGLVDWPCEPGTDPAKADTDGDGIKDGDEWWPTVAGLDLRGLGADPCKKDIFLEIDWVTDDDSAPAKKDKHKPNAAQLARIVAAFAAAPVPNPFGAPNGIALHISGGNYAGFDAVVDITYDFTPPPPPAKPHEMDGNFLVIKNGDGTPAHPRNFAANRLGFFYYCVSAPQFSLNGGAAENSSGISELPGNDFLCAWKPFGGWDTFTGTGSENHRVVGNTIMHELGHNLNLHHGGNVDTNYMPNYSSIMNYRYQRPGIDTDDDAMGDAAGLSYSTGWNIDLDENFLDEEVGVTGIGPAIDWDGDGIILPWPFMTAVNINCHCLDATIHSEPCDGAPPADPECFFDTTCDILRDYDDWANLGYGGLSDADKDGAVLVIETLP